MSEDDALFCAQCACRTVRNVRLKRMWRGYCARCGFWTYLKKRG